MTNSHSDQMENRGKDGYGSQWDIFHLKDEFHRIYQPFEILKLQARKSLRSSYAFALLLSLSWEKNTRSQRNLIGRNKITLYWLLGERT